MESIITSPSWGAFSLLFFFLFFVGVLAWVFRPGANDQYKDCADIPLKEDK
jgi:cytochrome c oxidase cbb3-type subunit 4